MLDTRLEESPNPRFGTHKLLCLLSLLPLRITPSSFSQGIE
jgi:hypothetical protein